MPQNSTKTAFTNSDFHKTLYLLESFKAKPNQKSKASFFYDKFMQASTLEEIASCLEKMLSKNTFPDFFIFNNCIKKLEYLYKQSNDGQLMKHLYDIQKIAANENQRKSDEYALLISTLDAITKIEQPDIRKAESIIQTATLKRITFKKPKEMSTGHFNFHGLSYSETWLWIRDQLSMIENNTPLNLVCGKRSNAVKNAIFKAINDCNYGREIEITNESDTKGLITIIMHPKARHKITEEPSKNSTEEVKSDNGKSITTTTIQVEPFSQNNQARPQVSAAPHAVMYKPAPKQNVPDLNTENEFRKRCCAVM